MSENRNRGINDFSKYDSMTTDELEEILRLDAEAPVEQESDTELLLYIMGVLADRRKNTNNTGRTASEAWESFQQHYLPVEEEYPEDTPEKKEPVRRLNPWLRRLTVAAAVVALVVCIPVTADAFGWEDLWNVVARWAKETFSFVSSEDTQVSEPVIDDNLEYESLQDVLERNKIDAQLVPTWIPDGYEQEMVEQDISPVQEIYLATYIDGDKELRIRVCSYIVDDLENIEINENSIEIYESAGIAYHICSNMDELRAIWIQDSYECYISGDLSIDELKMMIDSIGKG